MSQITEKTLIPLSLVLTFLGGVSWLTSISNRTDAFAQGLNESRAEVSALVSRLEKIQDATHMAKEELAAIRATQEQTLGRLDRMSAYMQSKLR